MAVEKVVPILEEETIEVELTPVEEEVTFDPSNTVLLDDGSAVVNYEEEENESEDNFSANLAENMEDSQLGELTNELLAAYKDDLESRAEWLESYIEGLDLLGTNTDERSEPFRGRQVSTTPSSQKVRRSSKVKRTKNSSHRVVQSKQGSSVKRVRKSKPKLKG